jgi:hypothetical protein
VDIFMEYCIDVDIVCEEYTSQRCSVCGARHKNGRIYKGLYECKKAKKINADINTALNIARKLGYRIMISRKIESYIVTHNDVKPLIPCQGPTHETRQEKIRLSRRREGHLLDIMLGLNSPASIS